MKELRRTLGPWDATAVVMGTVIGVGIFFTPSLVARSAGSAPAALGLWALGGLVAILGALTLARLGREYRDTGAHYSILRDAWGPLAGTLFVGCQLTAIQPGALAVIAHVCATNLLRAAGVESAGAGTVTTLAVALILGLCGANLVGVRLGSRIQNLTVLAKLGTLATVLLAAALVTPAPVAPAPIPPSTLLAGLLPAMFAYSGWQQVTWMAGEVAEPERVLPRAILVGVGLVVVLYLAAVGAWFAVLGFEGVAASTSLAYDAGAALAGPVGGRVAAGAVGVSAFGVLNALFLTAPRLGYALATDGRAPAVLGRAHPRFGTPWAAILLLGGVATLLLVGVGRAGIGELLAWQVVVNALFFSLTGLALVKRVRGRWEPVGWAALGFATAELLAVVAALWDPAVRAAAGSGLLWVGVIAALAAMRRR